MLSNLRISKPFHHQSFLFTYSSLLSLGAVHHYLISTRQRLQTGLIVETGDAREMHHFCLLLGYGADAICPYLIYENLISLRNQNLLGEDISDEEITERVIIAAGKGIRKVMAKMGISTLQSYKVNYETFSFNSFQCNLLTKWQLLCLQIGANVCMESLVDMHAWKQCAIWPSHSREIFAILREILATIEGKFII